ncbi:MAG: sodium:solute symporter [Planctomycetaceae bacterium]|nr:sodium:solute symporter [Planctomycetaceae bacterium]
MTFSTIDVFIVVIYITVSIAFGFWMGRNQKGTTDYFLGGRHIPWLAVTFSIVAAETSVLTFISIPAVSYLGDLRFIQLIMGYVVGRLVVAAIMIPAYYRGNIDTAYHFLGKRFGQKMRNIAGITFMATRLFADGVRLFATAIPLALILKNSSFFACISDRNIYIIAIITIGLVTMIYTCFGGIRSVVWVDVIQMGVYVGGAILAVIIIISKLPSGLSIPAGKFQWFYLGSDLSFVQFIKQPYSFFVAFFGGAIFTLASHGTDQLIIQRVLACGSKSASQKAIATSGLLVFLQFGLFLFLGILLFAYYKGQSFAQLGLLRADGIFPKFIVEQIPSGICGFIVAALFAAAMSTLAGSLSSLASTTVLDIYVPLFGKDKSQQQLLKLSRIATFIWGIILIITAITFINLKGTVVETALGIASYTYGGLLGVFLLGLFYKKAIQRDAIIAFFTAIIVMTVVIQTVKIAWPLYVVIGSATAVTTGIISYNIFNFRQK